MPDETATVAETEDTGTATEAVQQQVEESTVPKAQADALRRELAEAQRAAKRLEDQQAKAEEKRKEEKGQHQELAEQRSRELETERGERARVEREARIARVAGRLKFLDPQDVIGRVSVEDGADDASTETALERIAEQSPHLIAKEAATAPEIGQVLTPSATTTAGPQPPAGKAPLRTQADVEALSDREFEARYAEVQAVLRSPAQ